MQIYRRLNVAFRVIIIYILSIKEPPPRGNASRKFLLTGLTVHQLMYFMPAKPAGKRWGGRDLFAAASRLCVFTSSYTKKISSRRMMLTSKIYTTF